MWEHIHHSQKTEGKGGESVGKLLNLMVRCVGSYDGFSFYCKVLGEVICWSKEGMVRMKVIGEWGKFEGAAMGNERESLPGNVVAQHC